MRYSGTLANGAVTGAFGYLYNCMLHPGTCSAADYRTEMARCNGDDQNCIDDVVNDMEQGHQKLLLPDINAVFGRLATWDLDAALLATGQNGGAVWDSLTQGVPKSVIVGAELYRGVVAPAREIVTAGEQELSSIAREIKEEAVDLLEPEAEIPPRPAQTSGENAAPPKYPPNSKPPG